MSSARRAAASRKPPHDPVVQAHARLRRIERASVACQFDGSAPEERGGSELDRQRVARVPRHPVAYHLGPEPVSRGIVLVGRAPCDIEAAAARRGCQLLCKPRLADPGVARDDDEPALAPRRRPQLTEEHRKVAFAPDERDSAGPRHGIERRRHGVQLRQVIVE